MANSHKLTDAKVRNIKPDSKPRKYADGGGIYLFVMPAERGGGKLWRMAYRHGGKQMTLAIGIYPTVTLAMAREVALEAKRALWRGENPGALKRERKAAAVGTSFDEIAGQFLDTPKMAGASHSRKRNLKAFRQTLANAPTIKNKPFPAITHADFAAVVSGIAAEGKLSAAQEVAALAHRVCEFAVRRGTVAGNVASGLTKDLPQNTARTPRAAVKAEADLKAVLKKLDAYDGSQSMKYALILTPYVFLRRVELCAAEWREIDIEAATWTIPAERMKNRAPHVIPLAASVIALLKELYALNGKGIFVFPSPQRRGQHISTTGLRDALRLAGVDSDTQSLHGFRAVASTWLNEQGYNSDAIERQLAHRERNATRRAYDRGDRMPERIALMEKWAEYLDALRKA